MRLSKTFLCVPLLALACLKGASPTAPLSANEHQVLFVGNSLTYTNDLPGVFADLARAGGYDVGVQSYALASTALIDYMSDGRALEQIGRGVWDFVVLQQGTTSVPICRDTLVLAVQLMNPLIRRGGGVPAVMMSWPSANRKHVFPAVHDSHALAAQTVDGVFLPVGDAFLEAWKVNPEQPLYGSDGYHPGLAGTYLAALVIYEKFTGKDARQLPVDVRVGFHKYLLPPAQVRELQEAAHAANQLPVPRVQVEPAPTSPPISC